jgi:hypothetical protein
MKFYSKTMFGFENLLLTGLIALCYMLEDFRNLLGSNWSKYAKDIKQIRKIEKEMEKE